MSTRWSTLLVLSCAVAAATPALAGKLPPNAVPLTAEEVAKLHSGMTGIYPTTDEYFAPDGTTIGVFGKPVARSTYAGKWVVMGNVLCTLNGSSFDGKIYTDCNTFWRVGDKVMLLWSTHSDGSKADAVNGYFETTGTLQPGNLVADRYKAAGGR